MTVQHIWELAKFLWTRTNLYEYSKGKTLLVDVSVWFHTFANFEALDLVLSKKFDGILTKLDNRRQQLIEHGITPIFIFDGRAYPAKSSTNNSRQEDRHAAILACRTKAANGDIVGAQKEAKKAVTITKDLVYQFIQKSVRPAGNAYVHSPYESDQEIALLYRRLPNIAGVASIDGDMMVHGVPIFTTINFHTGDCKMMRPEFWLESYVPPPVADPVPLARSIAPSVPTASPTSRSTKEKKTKAPPVAPKSLPRLRSAITRFGMGILTDYAIVAGCDYRHVDDFPSNSGIGRETAVSIVCTVAENTGHASSLSDLATACVKKSAKVRALGFEKVLSGFQKVYLALCSAVVYDPILKKDVYLSDPEDKKPAPSHPSLPLESIVGIRHTDEEALIHVLFLDKPHEALPDPVPVAKIHRPGDALPTHLECWMIQGLFLSFFFSLSLFL